MNFRGSNSISDRGTVLLVSLCFVAVMGLVLGSYLALTTRAMQLSNRGFQAELSKQLAEAGLDEALRAFNKNLLTGTDTTAAGADWTSNSMTADWTLDTTNKRATATVTFPATKFGQGATAAVKIRVDNYDTTQLTSAWNSSTTYRQGDVVGNSGMWFTSVRHANTSNTPSTSGPFTWWVPAPIPSTWSDEITYNQYDLTNRNGIWYRYYNNTSSSTNDPPQPIGTSTHWVATPSMRAWVSSTSYAQHDVVAYTDPTSGEISVHRCLSSHTSSALFSTDSANWSTNVQTISFSWSGSNVYTRGAIILYGSYWYYCRQSGSSGTTPDVDTNRWARFMQTTGLAATPTDVAPTVGVRYVLGDYVYYSGSWRRCITEHTFASWAADSAKWTTTNALPHINWAWRYSPAKAYIFNDVVYYGGTWYRNILGYTSNATTHYPTHTSMASYWENALSVSWDWDSNDDYDIGDVVYLSGSFYRCIRDHTTSQSPPNSTYWSAEPLFSTYWDEGKNYNQYDTVRYRGRWYLSLQNSNVDHRPGTDATYWAVAAHSVAPWSATTTYHVDDFVSSGGNWYRSKKDDLNHTPPNSTYWDPVAGAGTSYVWNATTAYAAGVYRSYGGVWYKCLVTNTGESPNNPTYWTPTWAQSSGVTTGAPVVYAEATVTLGDGTTSRTQLRAIIDPATVFPNAAGSATTLSIAGGTGTVDSYDSELPAISSDPNGDNYVDTDAGYAAVLAAGSESAGGTSTLLTIGDSTTVKGYAAAASSTTTPFAPRASFGSSATVKGFSSPVSPNTDLAQVTRNPYVPKFGINPSIDQTVLPATLPTNLYLGTPGSPAPSYYYDISPSIATSVYINGPVIWYVNGNMRVNANDTIYINSTGSLTIYITNSTTGRLRVESTSFGIRNLTLDPKKLAIIGDTTSTGTQYYSYVNASYPFYGVIYLPYTTATAGLTIANGVEIYGALSANEITFSGAAKIHYDTSLRYATFPGVDQPYTVTEWRELPTTEAATLP